MDLLSQILYAPCCSYEDISDHNNLRKDFQLQTAVGQPDTHIIFRGDSGFNRPLLIDWLENNKARLQVSYLVGLAKNSALKKKVKDWEETLAELYTRFSEKQRYIDEFKY